MNQPSLSLSEVLVRIRTHADQSQWADAEALCHQLFDMLPDRLLQGTAWHWISLLRLQGRHNEACCVLHRFLLRQPWGEPVEGRRPASVVLVHGLDSLRRSNVQFISSPWDGHDFAITAGHFDSHTLLKHADFAMDHLYISADLSDEQVEDIHDRLGNYQVIINSIADPACETPALEMACRLLGDMDNVINPPQLVLQTERDLIADCLRELPGLVVPRLQRIEPLDDESRAELHRWLEQSPSGLILRPTASQTGLGMQRIVDPVALDAWLDVRPADGLFASNYHDFRSKGGLFRKFRAFVIDGQMMPEHMICARHWNLHSEDRYSLMDSTPALRDIEQAYLRNPTCMIGQQGVRTLQAIAQRLQLDYLGIDFSLLPDGRILLFETNPAMRLNYDHCRSFPYLRPYLDNVSYSFCRKVVQMMENTDSAAVPQTA